MRIYSAFSNLSVISLTDGPKSCNSNETDALAAEKVDGLEGGDPLAEFLERVVCLGGLTRRRKERGNSKVVVVGVALLVEGVERCGTLVNTGKVRGGQP